MGAKVELKDELIKSLCQKWKIKELALFGSVLRDDFDPSKSDIDVLITFEDRTSIGWEFAQIKTELEEIFGRSVDVVSKKALERSRNPFRKDTILKSYEVIYEQAS